MDPRVGDFTQAAVLIEGKKIVAVDPKLEAPGAAVIDARGKIVMPGFVDTHHHQFETALRGFLADGLLANDGKPHGAVNYFDYILGKFARVYRPQDVYINELFGSLSQLDAGVTTVHDISQIHHSPEHSDAAIKGLVDAGRRAAFGYFEGHGEKTRYPGDAARIKKQYFSSDDQLVTMIMGGEIYLPGYERAWEIGRQLNLPIAAHVVGPLGMSETFDKLAAAGKFGPDNLFIHMTGISETGWKATKDGFLHPDAFGHDVAAGFGEPDGDRRPERSTRSAHLARRHPLRDAAGREASQARSQGRLAHSWEGS
jgi:5-methylthioadenosine/S-adenosylhomocysteine deaminase